MMTALPTIAENTVSDTSPATDTSEHPPPLPTRDGFSPPPSEDQGGQNENGDDFVDVEKERKRRSRVLDAHSSITVDNEDEMKGAIENLTKMLKVETAKVVLHGLSCPGSFTSVSSIVDPGEICIVAGPELQEKKNIGPVALLRTLAGAPKKGTRGNAYAISSEKRFDLLQCRIPHLVYKTTIPRKLVPIEILQQTMIMDGNLSKKERSEVLKLLAIAFSKLMDVGRILSKTKQIGDRDVDDSQIKYGRDKCCQFSSSLTALERRKLEFLCEFVKTRRPNTMLMFQTKELSYHETWKFIQFLRAWTTRCETTNVIIHVKRISGRIMSVTDKLILMSDKHVLFSGRKIRLESFAENVLLLKTPKSFSVAEFVIDAVDPYLHGSGIGELAQSYLESPDYIASIERARQAVEAGANLPLVVHFEKFNSTWRWFAQVETLTVREFLNYVRTAGLTTLRCLLYTVFAVMIAVVSWLDSDIYDTSQSIWLLIALFDFVVAASLFGIFAMRIERKTLKKELATGRVLLSAWLTGQFFGSSLALLFVAIPPALMTYFLVDLNQIDSSAASVTLFVANFWLILVLCDSLWFLVAVSTPQKKNATVMASFLTLAFVLGQGLFTKAFDLPANRYVLFISIFKPAMNTFFSRTYSGSESLFKMPLEWSGEEECLIAPQSDRTFTASEVISCLDIKIWGGECDISIDDGTRWQGNQALDCLGYPPSSSTINFIGSILILLTIKLVTYLLVRFRMDHK